ncbi:MAG: YggT family protein [Actinomycetota bacterium]|nr:YggT family protein [Actinomycetota bacterium]
MTVVGSVLQFVLWMFLVMLIARLILDYVQMFSRSWRPQGVILIVAEAVYTVTDPPLKALRRVLPPLRIGNIALDLSFLVLVVLVNIGLQLTSLL